MENILKAIVGVMLVVLYTQRILFPGVADLRDKKVVLARLEQSLARLKAGENENELKKLKMQSQQITDGLRKVSSFLPPFDPENGKIEDKFENLKQQFPGKWKIERGGNFVEDGNIVRWPFKLRFEGGFDESLKALAFLESEGQIAKITSMQMEKKSGSELVLNVDLELLFSRDKSEMAMLEKMMNKTGGL